MPPLPRLSYQPALEGVRALAVAPVVASHYVGTWKGGYLGVDVFFVLSGFLITTLLWNDHAVGRANLSTFYQRRAVRLLPALVIVSILTVISFGVFGRHYVGTPDTLWGVVAALTYTSAWLRALTDYGFKWMGHAWSLSVEEWFYLLWPLAFRTLWTTDATIVRRRVSMLLAVALAYRGLALLTGFAGGVWMYNGPDFRAEQLLMGCLLAVCFIERPFTVPVGFPIAALVFFGGFIVAQPDHASGFYMHGGSTLVGVASVVLIAYLYASPRSIMGRALSTSVPVWVGKRSYGIYLFHLPIIGFLNTTTMSRQLMPGVALVLTIVLSALSYRFVEVPIRERFRNSLTPAADVKKRTRAFRS